MQSLLGRKAYFICPRYIYTGRVVSVDGVVHIKDAALVYDTGAWDAPKWSDAQPLPQGEIWIPITSIESCGPSNKS